MWIADGNGWELQVLDPLGAEERPRGLGDVDVVLRLGEDHEGHEEDQGEEGLQDVGAREVIFELHGSTIFLKVNGNASTMLDLF